MHTQSRSLRSIAFPALRRLLVASLLCASSLAHALEPPPEEQPRKAESDWRDPSERPDVQHYFLGVRYRGTIVPKFLMNIFADEGRTFYSNSVGAELDVRHGHFSVIPHLVYTEYGMEDTLFLQKGKDPSNAGNYSMINSGLKAIYLGADFLWSARIARHVDFEGGLGVGVGALFGDLVNNWVHADSNGTLVGSNGQHYTPCATANDGYGCNPMDHTTDVAKVGRYVEPKWWGGGSVPGLYLRLSVPIIGLRIKPTRDVEMRLQTGFAVTEGFFFQLSGNFRLPTSQSSRPAD